MRRSPSQPALAQRHGWTCCAVDSGDHLSDASGALFIMHSDGLGTSWNAAEYPELERQDPALIAGVLYRDFTRRRDDTTVVVGKRSFSA